MNFPEVVIAGASERRLFSALVEATASHHGCH
jgi:hypothetical protein